MCRIEFWGGAGVLPCRGRGGVLRKSLFPFFSTACGGAREQKRSKGRLAPCNPASQTDQKVGTTHVN